jgi:hypothetical protein
MEEYKIKEDGSIALVIPEQIIPSEEHPVLVEDFKQAYKDKITQRQNIIDQIESLQASLVEANNDINSFEKIINQIEKQII